MLATYAGRRQVVDLGVIQQVIREIAEEFRPRRIVLFGSYARGSQNVDSDVDILVIMPFEGSPHRQSIAIRRFVNRHGARFPMDLLVRTPEFVSERLAMEVVDAGRRFPVWRGTVPSNRWASVNPLPMRRHYEVRLPSNVPPGSIIRVTAIRPMMWLWRGAPVIREAVVPRSRSLTAVGLTTPATSPQRDLTWCGAKLRSTLTSQ